MFVTPDPSRVSRNALSTHMEILIHQPFLQINGGESPFVAWTSKVGHNKSRLDFDLFFLLQSQWDEPLFGWFIQNILNVLNDEII